LHHSELICYIFSLQAFCVENFRKSTQRHQDRFLVPFILHPEFDLTIYPTQLVLAVKNPICCFPITPDCVRHQPRRQRPRRVTAAAAAAAAAAPCVSHLLLHREIELIPIVCWGGFASYLFPDVRNKIHLRVFPHTH